MATPHRPETLTRLQARQNSLRNRRTLTETNYLDLGLEYHALPLQIRRTKGIAQTDCTAAFLVRESAPTPDCIGFLNDLRELYVASTKYLEGGDLDAAETALGTAGEILEALNEQLVAVRMCVERLHRQFSAMMDDGVEFVEGSEYRLAMLPGMGDEKHELLRAWVMALPEVREWFRSGAVRCEDEALMLAASAGLPKSLAFGVASGEVCLEAVPVNPKSWKSLQAGRECSGET